MRISLFALGALVFTLLPSCAAATKPNILLILADDQDAHMNSLSYQTAVQDQLVKMGTLFKNHFTTTSNCCPSRASLLRGQASHNTNITHVAPPGGGYLKWLVGGEDDNYLPQWLGKAGYKTEYIGKMMNGQTLLNYKIKPKGWNYVDVLLEPYTYIFNTVVMSANGEKPDFYNGWHQTDVIRAKSLARLDQLTSQEDPWFLTIAPTSPHVQGAPKGGIPPIPLERHKNDFPDLKVPKPDNFNPPDDLQKQKPTFLKGLKKINETEVGIANGHYRARIQAIQGLDEMVDDTIKLLEEKGQLDNTYIIYTSDNGYHIGTHRLFAGKSTPYIEDSNIPLVVRGPGVPTGAISRIPSTHIDFAPTFLDIAGIAETDRPKMFDGLSLLDGWKHSDSEAAVSEVDKEIINVEFWGDLGNEITGGNYKNNSYKTMRVVSDKNSWLYSRWCNGDTELYDTKADPYELINLALSPVKPQHQKIIDRLNALLLVTKSCVGSTCRDPWIVLKPSDSSLPIPQNLAEAMDSKYDEHFATFPQVKFNECINIQLPSNEIPFFPPEAQNGLGTAYRNLTDNFNKGTIGDCEWKKIEANGHFGTKAQRSATLADINRTVRKLTTEELPSDSCEVIM